MYDAGLRDQVHHDDHLEALLRKMAERRLQDIEERLEYLAQASRIQEREERRR